MRNAEKKLRKVFKEWFRNNNSPQQLILKYCEEMSWPDELKEDALYVVNKIKDEIEACQARVIVGVALFMIN